jgi:hypothetical protein
MNIRARIFGGPGGFEESLLKSKTPKGAKADELHSVAVARELRMRRNSRGEDRHRLVGERASLIYDGELHEVELINVSGGGAMIEGRLQPMLRDRVDLHLGDHGDIECAVLWIREGRIGLEFAHETRLDCAADEFASLLREVIRRSFPEVDFPTSDAAETAGEEQNRARPINWDEHRSAARHPLVWTGTLYHDFETTTARVRNISATGAMIECGDRVRVGAQPLLELSDSVSVSATVQWAVGDQVGLRFNEPFEMSLLASSRPLALPNEKRRSYLEKAADDAEAGVDHWSRPELSELRLELEGFLKR